MIQDLSKRTILRVSGSDAVRYINGQVSQNVKLASEELAVYSIVASFKGKIQGDFYIRTYQGDLLIDTSPSQSESLIARLDKYLIADDAEIEDISALYSLFHTIDEEDIAPSNTSWECDRYGQAGRDYLLPKSENLPIVTRDTEWEKLRISNKIPSWGKELDEDTLPPEAGIETRAISYTKGCYTGQEVISRMKSAGKTNKHLVGFSFEHPIETPLELYPEKNCEGKPGATVTSYCQSDSNSWIGLGYRTRKCESIETFYDIQGNTYTISTP
ncbi:MAG: YgfZ/GcvT domain-containing protein [Akkermansiaceae bacterium]